MFLFNVFCRYIFRTVGGGVGYSNSDVEEHQGADENQTEVFLKKGLEKDSVGFKSKKEIYLKGTIYYIYRYLCFLSNWQYFPQL